LDPSTNEPIQELVGTQIVTEPKYAGNIRRVTVCSGGTVVLEDKDNPSINANLDPELTSQTFLYQNFPFSLAQSVTDTTDPWGISDYEQLDGLQMEVNKSISQFTMFKDKASRVKLINPRNSGVKNSEFSNTPGVINPTNEIVAQGIRYMSAPEMPVDIVQALAMYKEFFFLVSGAFEMDQAAEPGKEVIAYKAIAALLERASTMLKGKIRNYSKLIRDRGRMYLSHVMNFYTEERWISFEENGEEQSEQILGTDLVSPAKLIVVSGSTMPISKVQEREEALALFQMGAIDLEELYKKIDWPDWKKVKTRMEQGPIGMFIQKLVALDLPQEFAEFFMQIAQMDEKELQKGLENGDIPTIPSLIQAYIQSGGTFEQAPSEMEQAEVQAKIADIQKTVAETELIKAKIDTENVNQEVSKAGMGFDEKKLKLEEAETVTSITETLKRLELEVQNLSMGRTLEAAKLKAEVEKADKDRAATPKVSPASSVKSKKGKNDSQTKNKSSKKKQQGPYREKGLKSNNKKK
jgi:hypothetical protein